MRKPKPAKGPEHSKGPDAKQDEKKKVDAAQIVLHVVQPQRERGNLELFHTPNRAAYATVKIRDHYETLEINSPEFKDLLCLWIYQALGEMPSDATLKKTLRALRGQALYGEESAERPVFHRIAEHGGCIYLDLCDPEWRVIEISPTGWWPKEDPPVRFVRSSVSRALPVPQAGGNLDDVFNFINISRREHQVLFLAWLLGALQTRSSYPILMLCGSQGSAKTTASRIAAALIDPAEPQMVSGYSSERDLLIDCLYTHVICIDNISQIDDRFSDALCRLATGSGMRRRKLYSDSTLFAVSAKSPLILNGIGQVGSRGDLLDRMITLRLDPIPENKRREEARILAEFKAKRPAILGALLSAVSTSLAKLPHMKKVGNLPRMADFAAWVVAGEKELGFTQGEFLKAYQANRAEQSDTTLEYSPIGLPLIQLIEANGGAWQGSIKDLLAALNGKFDSEQRDPDWPKSAKSLASALSRIDANLHSANYHIEWLRRDSRTRRRIVRLSKWKSEPVEFRNATNEESTAGRV
jgi:hypothetical protein